MKRALGLGGALALVALVALVAPQRIAQAQSVEPASPAAPADDIASIRAELARQARELEALKAQERVHEETSLRLSGYLQVDFVPYNQASQNELDYSNDTALNQNRFSLRRGHLRLDAQRPYLGSALEIDVNTTNGAQVRPIDAEVIAHWPDRAQPDLPLITVSAGLMKIPFGFEVPEHDAVRPFLERSTMSRALFPGEHDLGAAVHARYRFVDLDVAVMNGHPIADRVFPALAPVAHKEVVGRLGVSCDLAPQAHFDLGVSIDSGAGFHQGTPTTKDRLQWVDENGDGIVQATEVQVLPGSSATPSAQFSRFALGADARLALKLAPHAELDFRAEIVRASNLDRGLEVADPVGAGYDSRELGYYIGATQEVTRWGAVGLRYDHYDPDADAAEQRAALFVPRDRSYRSVALLAFVHWQTARFSGEYDINRNSLGRDASGAPTNSKSDSLTFRAQVQF